MALRAAGTHNPRYLEDVIDGLGILARKQTTRKRRLRRAPASLQELRELLARFRAGEGLATPGEKSIAALSFMLDNPTEAAVYSISRLAEELGVNPSTLTRLAKLLGFPGFSAFQALFRAELTHPGAPFSERASHWLNVESPLDTLQRVAKDELNNLQILMSHLDPEVFDRVAGMLVEAERIRIYGARLFHSLASFIAYCLGLIREEVALLADSSEGLAHGLLQLRPGDLLFLIGTAPYTSSARELAQLAREQGIRVVALTDAYSSPLAQHAEQTLIANTSGAFFANNVASSFILSEALLLETATRLGPRAVERLKLHEKLVTDLRISPSP